MIFYSVLFITLTLDQASKLVALRALSQIDTVEIIPRVFHFTLVHNTGIAFGFFRQHPSVLLLLITFSLIFIFLWGRSLPSQNKLERFAIGLILGGAAGNWLDRLRFGAVIDFLDFRVWPVFNIADSAITVGVTLFAWSLFKKKAV